MVNFLELATRKRHQYSSAFFVFIDFVCTFKEKNDMNVTKRDLIIIIVLFSVGLLCGLSIGHNAKQCQECNEFNVKIKPNEKIISSSTPNDSVFLEWKRRNGSNR